MFPKYVNLKPLQGIKSSKLKLFDLTWLNVLGHEYISQLVIAAADSDDFDSYGCEATNQMGYDYVRINLKQQGVVKYQFKMIMFDNVLITIVMLNHVTY